MLYENADLLVDITRLYSGKIGVSIRNDTERQNQIVVSSALDGKEVEIVLTKRDALTIGRALIQAVEQRMDDEVRKREEST